MRGRRTAADALGAEGARELQQLVVEQRARLDYCDQLNADVLVEGWERLVAEVERGYDAMVEEYGNDLVLREFLDDVLAVAPDPLARKIRGWSEPLDRRFLEATTKAEKPFFGVADPASPLRGRERDRTVRRR